MSEPTGGGTQQPDRDKNPEQDETSGSVFNDPTAPVWADPTTPIPAEPPVPPTPPTPPSTAPLYGAQPPAAPFGQQPPTPSDTPPASNPYAQQPPPEPGQQYSAYGEQPGQYSAYGQPGYATGSPTQANASGIVLTILSAILMLSTCFTIGVPSLVFGIMALTSNSTDPEGSRSKSKIGWIIFAINFGVVVLIAVIGFIALIAGSSNSTSSFNSSY
ncbi:MAG: hypothetical protein QOE58_1485 [Actinomycetota bacterium]|jgi:hypothetical protein|nr:hypothetical protein [Actinomycetota bacterium]